MRILVDMDSILADFLKGIVDAYFDDELERVSIESVAKWDHVFPNGKTCRDYFVERHFFRELAPIPGALDAMQDMHTDGHDLVIVSSVVPELTPHAYAEKAGWVAEHLPWFPTSNLVFCQRKEMVRGDILIDDHVKNAAAWKPANPYPFSRCRALTLAYTYNDDPIFDLRTDAWPAISEYIRNEAAR
jgi:5'-nucleotidase